MSTDKPGVSTYIENLLPQRKQVVTTIRALILETIPEAEETMRYNMPTYDAVGDFLAAIASQKHYISLYMNTDIIAAYKQELLHLNCGKSCIRFNKLEDLPLEVVKVILQETYEKSQKAQ